jgi:hypothetical protein
MTEQQISATVLPGPFIIDYSERDGVVITDTRGGSKGWFLAGDVLGLYSVVSGSAPGVSMSLGHAAMKNSEVGEAGSTGGVWYIRCNGIITVTVSEENFVVEPGETVIINGDEVRRHG